MLRKGSETTAHVAGFGLAIGGLRPSNTSLGFFDILSVPSSPKGEMGRCFFEKIGKVDCFPHKKRKSIEISSIYLHFV